jgi:hypothetical protein
MWKASNAVAIDIRGAKGLNQSTINGIYEPTEEVCSGWPVYRKRGDANKWLEFFIASNKVKLNHGRHFLIHFFVGFN